MVVLVPLTRYHPYKIYLKSKKFLKNKDFFIIIYFNNFFFFFLSEQTYKKKKKNL